MLKGCNIQYFTKYKYALQFFMRVVHVCSTYNSYHQATLRVTKLPPSGCQWLIICLLWKGALVVVWVGKNVEPAGCGVWVWIIVCTVVQSLKCTIISTCSKHNPTYISTAFNTMLHNFHGNMCLKVFCINSRGNVLPLAVPRRNSNIHLS